MDRHQFNGMNIHYRYFSLEYFFNSVFQNGLSNVELWLCPQHFYINNEFVENTDRLKKLCNDYQQKIDCICPEQNNPKPNNVAAKGELLINNTLSYYKNVFKVAHEMNCHKVLITPGWNYYDETISEARGRSITMLKKLCNLAEEKEIELVLESIWAKSSQIASTIEQIGYLKEAVNKNNLRLTLDLGAMAAANETIEEWFKVFGKDLRHCHFVDGNPTGHMSWGRGTRDMEQDLHVFQDFDYNGKFSFEFVYPECYKNPSIEDKISIEKYKNIIKKGDFENDKTF